MAERPTKRLKVRHTVSSLDDMDMGWDRRATTIRLLDHVTKHSLRVYGILAFIDKPSSWVGTVYLTVCTKHPLITVKATGLSLYRNDVDERGRRDGPVQALPLKYKVPHVFDTLSGTTLSGPATRHQGPASLDLECAVAEFAWREYNYRRVLCSVLPKDLADIVRMYYGYTTEPLGILSATKLAAQRDAKVGVQFTYPPELLV